METAKRLIDANALPVTTLTDGEYWTKDVVYKRDIDEAPTVDAVEVVRCKDCKKWYRHTVVDRERGGCRRYQTTKHETGFCDRGERRIDGR